MIRAVGVTLLLSLALGACTTTQKAPVIDRMPVEKKPEVAAKPAVRSVPGKDWRPDVHTVKKGDTLYSIGLEYGYDYKEIAQANNIAPPYVIRVGQQLKLKDGKPAAASAVAQEPADNGVVVTPLNTEGTVTEPVAPSAAAVSGVIPTLSEPKALREPYSEKALLVQNTPAKPADAPQPTDPARKIEVTKPAEPMKPSAMPGDDEVIEWAWPTNGKVVGGFNDASSGKGIDIAGTPGQSVMAAAPGKVIYSGSDLRGYGKLVIIKHNKTYLSVYAHNSNILVKEGQFVSRGQKIAEMGNSDSDKVKLHFEIRQQGKSVDPSKYLPGNPG